MNKLNVNTIRVYGMTSRFLPTRLRDGNYQTYVPDVKDQNDPDKVARCDHTNNFWMIVLHTAFTSSWGFS